MRINYFNNALRLINNKPSITQMRNNDYYAYTYPQPVIDYACKVLNARELKLYLQIGGQANGFNGAMKFYSDKANIRSNHYSEILDNLEKKGFIKHTLFESIEVVYLISESEYISENGEIKKITVDSTKKPTYQKGNNASYNEQKSFLQKKEEKQLQNENTESTSGNNDSQIKGYNKEINNLTDNNYIERDWETSFSPKGEKEVLSPEEKKQSENILFPDYLICP